MLGIFQTLTQAVKNQQVRELFSSVQAIEQSLVFDQYKSLLVAVLAGLYSYTFARDYNYHNIRNLLVRVSYKDYVTTKVLVNIGGTIASVIIGFLLTSFLTIPVMPLESSADISYNSGCISHTNDKSKRRSFVPCFAWNEFWSCSRCAHDSRDGALCLESE